MKYILFIVILLNISCNALLAFEVLECPGSVKQGNTLSILISPEVGEKEIKCKIFGNEFKFYPDGLNLRAIVGVDILLKPGEYPLRIQYYGISGSLECFELFVTIKKSTFTCSWVKLNKKKMTLLNDELLKADAKKLSLVFSFESDSRYWTGRFNVPVKYRYITTKFGHHRVYNKRDFGYHRGIDFAASLGKPVKPANDGYVVLSDYLSVHGNTIVVNHGQGIMTIYCHLDKRIAAVGDFVFKKTIIGTVGNSGLSSGPHLHFGLSVHDTRVDPAEWLNAVI